MCFSKLPKCLLRRINSVFIVSAAALGVLAAAAGEDLRGANPQRVRFIEGKHGAFFDSPADGVEAHIQHLYAYATTAPLPSGKELLDPRFVLVKRGCATCWIDLGGKWATPGFDRGKYSDFADAFAGAIHYFYWCRFSRAFPFYPKIFYA